MTHAPNAPPPAPLHLCSVKDRLAYALIKDAEERGVIQPGKVRLQVAIAGQCSSPMGPPLRKGPTPQEQY